MKLKKIYSVLLITILYVQFNVYCQKNEEITNNNNKKAKKNNKGIKNKYSYKGRPWNERKEEDEHSEDDGGQGASVDCQQSKRSVR